MKFDDVKIGIVGCGKIADQHVQAIHRIPDGEDCRSLRSGTAHGETARRAFGYLHAFLDLSEMLKAISARCCSHYHSATEPFFARETMPRIWKPCLSGKTFYDHSQGGGIVDRGRRNRDLKITVGHNLRFTSRDAGNAATAKRRISRRKADHLESHFSYDLGDTRYAEALLRQHSHWVHQLPGELLHNVISHGIAKLAEFLDDDLIEIVATAGQSAQLKSLGGRRVLDELRVLIRDKSGTTAFFCFSTQIKGLNQLRFTGQPVQ